MSNKGPVPWLSPGFCMKFSLALCVGLVVQGCMVLDAPRPRRSRGTLSGALERSERGGGRDHGGSSRPYVASPTRSSRGQDRASRGGFPPPPPPPEVELFFAGAGDSEGQPGGANLVAPVPMPARPPKKDDGHVFKVITYSVLNQVTGHSYLEEGRTYCLAGEWREGKLAFGLRGTFASMDFRRDWQYSDQLDDPRSFDLGVEGKLYFAGREHFLQPYVGVSLAYGTLRWSYRDWLYDPETGDEIRTDDVDYLRLGAIAGIFVRFTKEIRLAAEVRPDITFPGATTSNGFINDIIGESKGAYAGLLLSVQFE